jgi:outer membrane protein insertion porin family
VDAAEIAADVRRARLFRARRSVKDLVSDGITKPNQANGHPTPVVACAFPPQPTRAVGSLSPFPRVLRLALSAACALGIQFSATLLPAQSELHTSGNVPETAPFTAEMLASYDGQLVSSVQLAGLPNLKQSEFAPLLMQKAGRPFSDRDVEQSAAALKAKGNFEAVRIEIEPETKGIRVVFVLEPGIYFGVFEFPGAERFPYPRLLQVTNYPVQAAFSENAIQQAERALVSFFREQGYFHATVQPQVQVDTADGIANVFFHTELGVQAKFDSVDMEGIPQQEASIYRQKLRSIWTRVRGAAIRPGKTYHYETITRAQRYLQHLMESKDLLSAQVVPSGAEYNAATNEASVHFKITPGTTTHLGIEGAHLWSWTRKSLLPFYQGVGVDSETVDEGRQALVSYFQGKGFFNVSVQSELLKNSKGETVIYQVVKGEKRKVSEVTLSGNKQVHSSALKPGIEVKKAHLFARGNFSQKLVSESVTNLTNIYESRGYASAQVKPRIASKGKDVQVYFHVTEGPRDIVNSLTIEGAKTLPESKFAPKGLQIAAGKPYSQLRVEADRAGIVNHYQQAGYLTSTFRETAAEVSKRQPHRINVVYHIYEGPRVMTGRVMTLGRKQTQQRLINEDVSLLRPGNPLTESDMLGAGTELYNHTGVFDWAEVDPKRPVTTQTREDVLVKVHEAKRNDFTYGIGFEIIDRGGSLPTGTVALPSLPPIGLPNNFTTSEKTFYGPRGTAEYTRNNLYGKGDSLSLTAFAGRLDQRGAIYLINPKLFWEAWRGTTTLSIERDEENPIFSFQQELGSFQLQKPIDRSRKDILFLRYSLNKTSLTRVLISQLVPQQDRNVRLSTLAANLTRDTRDNPLNEHSGVLRSLELDFNTTKLGSSVNFAKAIGQAAFYKEKFDHIVWADSIRIGMEEPFGNSFVPLSEEFFTGGGNSLRGFPLDGAGPQRPVDICNNGASSCGPPCVEPTCSQISVPTGGNELLILNSEARIPLPFMRGLRIVPFYDGGNVFSNVGFHDFLSLYSNNVGLGLRYDTPVGPIRFDVGRNLNPIPGVSATQYFVSIGQAF